MKPPTENKDRPSPALEAPPAPLLLVAVAVWGAAAATAVAVAENEARAAPGCTGVGPVIRVGKLDLGPLVTVAWGTMLWAAPPLLPVAVGVVRDDEEPVLAS